MWLGKVFMWRFIRPVMFLVCLKNRDGRVVGAGSERGSVSAVAAPESLQAPKARLDIGTWSNLG